jgi:hypothetical protein
VPPRFFWRNFGLKREKRGLVAALFDFSLLYPLSQVGGGKPEKIMTLFLLGNVGVGGDWGGLGA